MATYTKQFLSNSTSGQPITIASTASASATALHVGPSGTSMAEVWLWASASGATTPYLNIQMGAATSGATISVPIPPGGTQLVSPGWIMGGGQTVSAWSNVGSVIIVTGFSNLIS